MRGSQTVAYSLFSPAAIQRSGDTGKTEFIYALWVDVGLSGRVRQFRIGVAGVAKRVVGGAEKFIAETQVQSQRLA